MATKQTAPAVVPANGQAVAPLSLSQELAQLQPEVEKVLPPHIGAEKFMRVVNTALVMSPDLRNADRRSLFTAAVKAATDGLMPDGREGAFVIFKNKVKDGQGRETWIQAVQWMPMIAGVIKKIRNSGELKSIASNVVHTADTFKYWIDDDGEHVLHEPAIIPDRGPVTCAYAIAKTVNGGVYTEVMTAEQIAKVRAVSRSGDSGPWKTWPDEMARKSVLRRLAKRLPMSTDLEQTIQRDDELYDLEKPRNVTPSTSGTEAARRALGLEAPVSTAEAPEQGDGDVSLTEVPAALAAIAACQSIDELDSLSEAIGEQFQAAKLEVPVEIDAAVNDKGESLTQAANH